jgi:excinuclease ABC subunit A
VVVIEHNLDVIKTADWLIDLGPEGGFRGGRILAEGTPEEVAELPDSYTGQFLKPLLDRQRALAATNGNGTGPEGAGGKRPAKRPSAAKVTALKSAASTNGDAPEPTARSKSAAAAGTNGIPRVSKAAMRRARSS